MYENLKLENQELPECFRPKHKEEEPPVKQWTKENTWTVIILIIISWLAGCPVVLA
jgi:hypothetical protein